MSIDLFQIGITINRWFRVFTIRFYSERNWGKRELGPGRFAFDVSWLSFVFEKYATDRTTYEQLARFRNERRLD